MITIVLQAAALIYVFVLPGTLLLWALGDDWSPMMRVAMGGTLSALTIPMLSFCAAWLLGTSIRPAVPLGVASLVNLVGVVLWWIRRRRQG